MIIAIIIILISILIYWLISNKVKIKFKTFLKKGFKVSRGIFGIYCYCGSQGSGKTYSCVEYVYDNYDNIQLFSNIHIHVDNYVHFTGFKEMLKLRDCLDWAKQNHHDYIIFNGKKYKIDFSKQIIFIYDELFSELTRGSKLTNDVLDFITQMRKRKFILLTTTQIWSDIPLTWRRLTRYQIDCSMVNKLGLNLLIKVFHDAEHMKWSNDDQEFLAPIISTTITHTRSCISILYDTFEVIHNKNFTSLTDEVVTPSSLVKDDLAFLTTNNNSNVSRETLTNDIDNDFWSNESKESLEESESNLCLKINKY